jgi:prepilin-type N-terminal cleavage/methylation domain-containing protein
MNKKGFTLVELLAVIVILAVVAVITIPVISRVIKDTGNDVLKINKELMVKASESYYSINEELLPTVIGGKVLISLSDLVDNGYIKEIKNPSEETEICEGFVIVTKEAAEEYIYDPYLKCGTNYITDNYDNARNFIYTFDYTGDYQTFIIPISGTYKIEIWGAQGGTRSTTPNLGGAGGYTTGNISFTAGQVIYLYIGQKGIDSPDWDIDGSTEANSNGGYNGGGNGAGSRGPGGGGATDIRLGGTNLNDRIIVAAGGGGNAYDAIPSPVKKTTVAQVPNSNSILGIGSDGTSGICGCCACDTAGGGGGYYGGQSVTGDDESYAYSGTNYISPGFSSTTSQYGIREGNGYAKITFIN